MSKIKLLIADGFAPLGLQRLEESNLFTVSLHKGITKDELLKVLPEQDAIIIRSATKLTKDLIESGTELKAIMRAGSGVDNIDVSSATDKGIFVFNTPGANNNAVVELTLGYIFALLRELPRATSGMKKNMWEKKALVGGEALDRSLGVLGLGAIGSLVAQKARALGMELFAYDPRMADLQVDPSTKKCSTINEVFEKSSMVSVHIPLAENTRHSIGTEQFQKMAKGSYLINCSRGGIVKEDDLLCALEDGTLAGAAMDVFEAEPTNNEKLVAHPKFICTPHIGASTKESQKKVALSAADSLIKYFSDGNTTNAINKNRIN